MNQASPVHHGLGALSLPYSVKSRAHLAAETVTVRIGKLRQPDVALQTTRLTLVQTTRVCEGNSLEGPVAWLRVTPHGVCGKVLQRRHGCLATSALGRLSWWWYTVSRNVAAAHRGARGRLCRAADRGRSQLRGPLLLSRRASRRASSNGRSTCQRLRNFKSTEVLVPLILEETAEMVRLVHRSKVLSGFLDRSCTFPGQSSSSFVKCPPNFLLMCQFLGF